MGGAFFEDRKPSYAEQISGWLVGGGAPEGGATDRVASALSAPQRGMDYLTGAVAYEPAKNLAAFPMDPSAETAKTTGTEAALTFTPVGKIGAALSPLKSLFLGLPAIKRLTEAGRIKQGAWGSPEALGEATHLLGKDATPAMREQAWRNYGWGSRDMFGPIPEGADDVPISWHTMNWTPNPSHRGIYGPGVEDNLEYSGTIGDFFPRAAPDLKIAHPGMQNAPLRVSIDKERGEDFLQGAVATEPLQEPAPWWHNTPVQMELSGRNFDDVQKIAQHEAQHFADGLASPAYLDLRHSSKAAPHSEAADKLTAQLDKLLNKRPPAGASAMERYEWSSEVARLTRALETAPDNVLYLTSPHEKIARASRLSHDIPNIDDMYPGHLDLYSPESMAPAGRNLDIGDLSLSIRDYKPKDITPNEASKIEEIYRRLITEE